MQPYKKLMLEELKHTSVCIRQELKKFLKDSSREEDPWHPAFANLFAVLFFHEMRHDPQFPQWNGKDYLLTSDPRSLPALLTVLTRSGYLQPGQSEALLPQILQLARNGIYQLPGVQGISAFPSLLAHYANGLALSGKAARIEYKSYYIFKPMAEAQVLEPAYAAANNKLNNLVYLAGALEREERIQTIHRWFALGWHIEEVDWLDLESILQGFSKISRQRKVPNLLIG